MNKIDAGVASAADALLRVKFGCLSRLGRARARRRRNLGNPIEGRDNNKTQ
jgi:hypothetical protein